VELALSSFKVAYCLILLAFFFPNAGNQTQAFMHARQVFLSEPHPQLFLKLIKQHDMLKSLDSGSRLPGLSVLLLICCDAVVSYYSSAVGMK
jgi:hypothetical protein